MLQQLGTREVMLMGGPAAIRPGVEHEFRAQGYEVRRVAGADRYETASAAALALSREDVGVVNGQRTVLLANGATFPDALAASPLACADGLPILLTTHDALPPTTVAALAALDIEQVVLLGGPAAVSESVEQTLRERGLSTLRLAGATRAGTAAAVAGFAVDVLGFARQQITVARGDDFADALAGGALGCAERSVILLSDSPAELGEGAHDYLATRGASAFAVTALGGTGAISDPVLQAALGALLRARATQPVSVTATPSAPSGAKVVRLPSASQPARADLTRLLGPQPAART